MSRPTRQSPYPLLIVLGAAVTFPIGACARPRPDEAGAVHAPRLAGAVHTVRDSVITSTFEAAGVAAPFQEATLSTKLMGTVLQVLVQEGDAVATGQLLARVDARDLAAKGAQSAASMADADALLRDALTQANRMRALYADSAATRAQLDAAETGLARAQAGTRAAHASAAELGAVSSYALIRAPFAGIVTRRFLDAGAFASPGAPIVTVQDASRLRVSASATPDVARSIRRGALLAALIEGRPHGAIVEGVVPATAGNLYTINAIVANPGRTILPGSAATLALPTGARVVLVVPAAAIRLEGDLTGVVVRTAEGDDLRWVRLGARSGTVVEVSSGLRAGDQVVVPTAGGASPAREE